MIARLGIAATLLCAGACSRLSPAGFWSTYRPELILSQSSDQGPWGGTRRIHWQSSPGSFSEADVVGFATEHGWTVVGRCSVPPPSEQYGTTMMDVPCLVLACTSGWVRVEPGSGRADETSGFVEISTDGSRLSVSHRWGE